MKQNCNPRDAIITDITITQTDVAQLFIRPSAKNPHLTKVGHATTPESESRRDHNSEPAPFF
jgi:hypothetical protein